MKKISILISHIPNPRILKRIKTLEDDFDITLIYWDRGQEVKETFEINSKNKTVKIAIDAPHGNPIKRIVPLLKYIGKAIKVLKDGRPDIIHAANLDMLLIARIYKAFYNKDIKIVYEVADLPRYSFAKKINSFKSLVSKLLQGIERRLISKISRLILTSPYFWDEYFSKFVDEDKYLFVPNAPYKSLFEKYSEAQHDKLTIAFIGSVRYTDQLKILIDSVGELKKGIRVFIAGSGPGYQEILEYSKDKDFVEIYGPYNYEKEIVSLYEKVDIMYSVYDSNLENVKIALPNRLYESIVCEKPIIASRGTELGKFIEREKIGFTVDSNGNEELKEKILYLINSKETLNLYKNNCKNIKEDYYYENVGELLIKNYKNL